MLRASRFVHRTALIMFLLSFILVLSMLVAPATLEPGTAYGLDARANAMDHVDKWKDMDPFHFLAYSFGDLNCHQRVDRTIIINGNQMPVCARDTGIFIGLMMGSVLLIRARANDDPTRIIASILPRRMRGSRFVRLHPGYTMTFLLLLMFVPTAMDGGVQMLSEIGITPFGFDYESTNPTRLLTGFPLGVSVGILFTMLLMTLFSRRDDGSEPLLPFFARRRE